MKNTAECKLEIVESGTDAGTAKLSGVLNFDSIMQLNQQAGQIFPKFKSMIIDLSDVTYVNSAGLALLLEWQRKAILDKQTLRISGIPRKLINIARVSEIEDILPLH